METSQDNVTGQEEVTDVVQQELIRTERVCGDHQNVEVGSTTSKKILSLRNSKKLAKTRMTKAKKQLSDLIEVRHEDIPLPRKNAVRRAMNRVTSEMKIIASIIDKLRELYAVEESAEASEGTNAV